MRVRFVKHTRIRRTAGTQQKPLGVIHAGTEIDVDEKAIIDAKGRKWYRDQHNWYYWAGGVEEILSPQPPTLPLPPPEIATNRLEIPPVLPDDPDPRLTMYPGETRYVAPRQRDLNVFLERNLPADEPLSGKLVDSVTESRSVIAKNILLTDPGKLNWGLRNHQVPRDWWQENDLTGSQVRLAVLSTGIDSGAKDLEGAVWAMCNFHNETDIVGDIDGLGTQAAVVAAGRGALAACGVAPGVQLLIGKIGDHDRDITPEKLKNGMEWALRERADVMALLVDFRELSLQQEESLAKIVQAAHQAGVVLVAPVGNSAERRPVNRAPALFEEVISVGAHDPEGNRSDFSAKSYRLDVMAPGEQLLTAGLGGAPTTQSMQTTSIAAAYVAGLIALIKQWRQQNNKHLSPDQIRDVLRSTAIPNREITKGIDVEYGFGRLHPQAILKVLTKQA